MQSKFKFNRLFLIAGVFAMAFTFGARAEVDFDDFDEEYTDEYVDDYSDEEIVEDASFQSETNSQRKASSDAVAAYNPDGSLFEQITSLEQEKILMQLEKERAQLDLDLDKLAAEKIKLHMEIDNLSGRAEQQQQLFEAERAKLEAEVQRLVREKENTESNSSSRSLSSGGATPRSAVNDASDDTQDVKMAAKYKLVNVYGAGNQLQATVADLSTGQNKRVSAGKVLDGYTVKSISLDEGVVFVKDGVTETLNVSSK